MIVERCERAWFRALLEIVTGCFLLSILTGTVNAGQLKPEETEAFQRAKAEALTTLLNTQEPKSARLSAIQRLGFPPEESLKPLRGIVMNQNEADDLRLATLKWHPFNEELIAAEFEILKDASHGGEDFHAEIIRDLVSRAMLPHHATMLPKIMSTVRGFLNDTRPKVRLEAFRALVTRVDAPTIDLLIAGLGDRSKLLIPPSEAILLLDIAGSKEGVAAVRPYLDDSDLNVRAQAAEALAKDPPSFPKLVSILQDRKQPMSLRLVVLRSLAQNDETFPRYTLDLLSSDTEDPELRKWIIHRFVGFLNYHNISDTEQVRFAKLIQQFKKSRGFVAEPLVDISTEVAPYLQENFPTIRDYYKHLPGVAGSPE